MEVLEDAMDGASFKEEDMDVVGDTLDLLLMLELEELDDDAA